MDTFFAPEYLMENYWDGSLPVNYFNITKKLNIRIEENELESLAFLEKKGKDIVIYISSNAERKNVIIAFALSKLHVGLIDGGYTINQVDFNTNEATFHSRIAQKNLHKYVVPEEHLFIAIKQGNVSIDELALLFDVSEVLIKNALEHYGIL